VTILSIDPGRAKCGLAVVDADGRILHREIVETPNLVSAVGRLSERFQPTQALIGDGTQSATLRKALRTALPELPLESVPEAYTSQRARTRWWQVNPPLGVARLVPTTLRTPPVPWDDWVAVILAEDWLAAQSDSRNAVTSDHQT
jgi:hypothetical protein